LTKNWYVSAVAKSAKARGVKLIRQENGLYHRIDPNGRLVVEVKSRNRKDKRIRVVWSFDLPGERRLKSIMAKREPKRFPRTIRFPRVGNTPAQDGTIKRFPRLKSKSKK